MPMLTIADMSQIAELRCLASRPYRDRGAFAGLVSVDMPIAIGARPNKPGEVSAIVIGVGGHIESPYLVSVAHGLPPIRYLCKR